MLLNRISFLTLFSLSITLLPCFLSGSAFAQEMPADPVFDVQALIATPLNPRTMKQTEKDGIVTEEVMFHSETDEAAPDGNKDVEIFGYFAYPVGGKNLPAFIWNQAGLGQASTYFTDLGAKRGYAVLCIDMPMPHYRSTGGYPITMPTELPADLHRVPFYHGAVALLKAVSYLQARPEVDKDRIGMAGSSWGGLYTTLMVGLDPRLKAGAAMFGTGNLQLGNAWWDTTGQSAKYDAAFRERWRTTLDPAWRLQFSKTPIAWFTGTNDHFCWMPDIMETYKMAAGPKHLTLLPNWDHGLTPTLDSQVFEWLDVYLKGKPAFDEVTPIEVTREGNDLVARWTFSGPRPVHSAQVFFSHDGVGMAAGTDWPNRHWIMAPATIKDNTCTAKLPDNTLPYYAGGTVIDNDGFYYSTPLLHMTPEQGSFKTPTAVVDYDGAGEWGSFEPDAITFIMAMTVARSVTVATDAHDGKQSVMLKPGKNDFRDLRYTGGVPHRLTAYLKAGSPGAGLPAGSKPISVTVTVGGTFDGRRQAEEKTFEIGKDWTPVAIDFTPPAVVYGDLSVDFALPPGATALLDSVSFKLVGLVVKVPTEEEPRP
jgi:dienelactone hydrolase